MPRKYFSAHGHFYQPPRVDPRTGQIPQEKGAQPYSNWTERIYHECYLPNTRMGNFEKISFNFGPTLTAWLAKNHPDTLAEIVRQEHTVFTRSGFSNALAQPYIHAILPLIPRREKETLVRWGISDYTHHYGHAPQGMWLPETAVDHETLEVLADHGMHFTILAPWQAEDASLDITQPYRVQLPNGNKIAIFFFNSFLSSEISFNTSATMEADTFVSEWLIPQSRDMFQEKDQLFLAASDGELYGHHMKEREEFLSYLYDHALKDGNFIPVFPAEWLESHPTLETTRIKENTSWSCHHGIERWKDVCGDAPKAFWKAPLRKFLDQLADALDSQYFNHTKTLIDDPWALRDMYSAVLLGTQSVQDLIAAHAKFPLDKPTLQSISDLLESQLERLRMHSSDAWFFFDFDTIEPLNGLKYAAHAVWLVKKVTGEDVSAPLLKGLSDAKDNGSGLTGDAAFCRVLASYQ